MLCALRRWVPIPPLWKSAPLTLGERAAVETGHYQTNLSLAPYLGLISILVLALMMLVDFERYQHHVYGLNLLGSIYLVSLAGNLLFFLSIPPALALWAPQFTAKRKETLLQLHLHCVIIAFLLMAVCALITRGVFLRLAILLVLVNLFYITPWKTRAWINGLAIVIVPCLAAWLPPEMLHIPVKAKFLWGDMVTLIGFCSVGGMAINHQRANGYLAQYREQLSLERLREELRGAGQLQQSLLPLPWPATEAFSIHGVMRPALDIGGDFYDHFKLHDGSVSLIVADVCGKGVAAGLYSMAAKSALRATALPDVATTAIAAAGALMTEVNESLHGGNPQLLFVTAVYAHYQPTTGQLEFVNAGHVQPLLIAANGAARWLAAPRGRALGARGQQSYAAAPLALQPGDTLLMVTDGITEAMNAAFEEFGLARTLAAFDGPPCYGPVACIDRLLAAVDAFTGGTPQSDDITCIALSHRPAA